MNTLTKVLVVLQVIFSIAFTMMTVQYSAMQPNWKDQAEKWRTFAQMADTYNRNLATAKVAETAKAAADRKAWEDEKAQINKKLDEASLGLADVTARLTKSETESTLKDGTLKRLTAELSVAQTSAESARGHRDAIEKKNIELERANLDLNERNNESVATIIVLEQQVRQQDQSINLLKKERDKLMKQTASRGTRTNLEEETVTRPTDKVMAGASARVAPIRGRVDEVSGDYATISVGTDDGVEVGMTFIIYATEGYIGDLEVMEVTPETAAGKLRNLAGQVLVGSLVADESGYLAMQ